MAKQIQFNEDARSSIKKGIDKLAQAVKMTLGPRGRAAVIEKSYGPPQITFDGVTVAKEVELEDKFENLGAELIKQAADKTNDQVGDGTTTAVVLAHTIIEEGEKAISSKGFNVIQLAEELKKHGQEIVRALESQKEDINDTQKIQEVASLSAKDKNIGKLIAQVFEKVGKEGVISVDDSKTVESEFELVEGMQFDRGYISPYMATNGEKMTAELENPYILVTDKKISSIKEILPILEKVVESGKKELVIIAEDLEGEALTTLILNKIKGTFNVLALKAPGFGDRKKEMLEDIALVTGAKFVSQELGIKFEDMELADLGHATKVVSDKDETTIVDGKGDKKEIEERVKQLKGQVQNTESSFDKEKLQERLGKLSGGVAVIKVGAPTESAQKELKQRVEDAVSATRAAMEEGIVPGGGMALFNVAEFKESQDEVVRAAQSILHSAMQAPVTEIVKNSGQDPAKIIAQLKSRSAEENWKGFNASTNQIEDLKTAGIIDPLKVTKTAFTNAVSVASTYLMMGVAMTEVPKKDEPMPQMGGMGMGM
ncbi:MAG: chaperonin GroEL [bacterium]|nr:chaperonin GroEL [bacterium]